MKAIAVFPGTKAVRPIEQDVAPIASPTGVLIRILEVGVCGTDRRRRRFRGAPRCGGGTAARPGRGYREPFRRRPRAPAPPARPVNRPRGARPRPRSAARPGASQSGDASRVAASCSTRAGRPRECLSCRTRPPDRPRTPRGDAHATWPHGEATGGLHRVTRNTITKRMAAAATATSIHQVTAPSRRRRNRRPHRGHVTGPPRRRTRYGDWRPQRGQRSRTGGFHSTQASHSGMGGRSVALVASGHARRLNGVSRADKPDGPFPQRNVKA
jgi:hypothetical protein